MKNKKPLFFLAMTIFWLALGVANFGAESMRTVELVGLLSHGAAAGAFLTMGIQGLRKAK